MSKKEIDGSHEHSINRFGWIGQVRSSVCKADATVESTYEAAKRAVCSSPSTSEAFSRVRAAIEQQFDGVKSSIKMRGCP